MCAILDADVVGEIFANDEGTAGVQFRRWVAYKGQLVVGGKLLQELRNKGPNNFRIWQR